MAEYKKYKRIFGLVLDSVGAGEAPDAKDFDDEGADTLGHLGSFFKGDLKLPNLQKLGVSNMYADGIPNLPKMDQPLGYYGKMREVSVGVDSLEGHWEMMGLPVMFHFDHFPDGFPDDLLDKISAYAHRGIIKEANKPISGTTVIAEYGEEQLKTGDLIIYTSGDSVLQIAANTAVIPLEELYDICRYARSLVNGPEYRLGRVIARPYVGDDAEHFERTSDRHDFAFEPYDATALDCIQEAGFKTIGIGKINDIFTGRGIDEGFHNDSDMDGMDHVLTAMEEDFTGFCFTNLVDFDAKFGHRRNAKGYGENLMNVDTRIGEVMDQMHDDDLLMITADHGNDPTYKGTDHTRELVPLLVYSPSMTETAPLGTRDTYADFGATILDNFNLLTDEDKGTSFLDTLN
ncbi:MAG: phosphopentomutase [Aerococcus sp.]|nr:phosphopentomutase [Aerococcus sp.]